MPGFFQPVEEISGVKPFEGFPVEFSRGSLSALVSTDELAGSLFVHTLLSEALKAGKAYHVGPKRVFSPSILRTLEVEPSNLLSASVYSADELVQALDYVEDDSTVLVSQFPTLKGVSRETLLELRRRADEGSLTLVLHHETLTFNELDLPGEFARLFLLPELFDSLIVLRTSSYRGHYKLNATVLKAPPEQIATLGDHSIPVDSLVRTLTGR
ncbi:hypothetical protein [Thermococcus sp. 21S9]|uniref:hypothetical protein n=1 Tax=Thermococcus sp. 21S9 TaxID=1638223 RepID=UPI00143AAE5D|nr:hypothetical protein [Thermococcus sp. 21S9]NJE55582.1 hypothetical protein [Thermococcus sp. 21S9]